MTLNKDNASSEFESIARRGVLEAETDRVASDLDIHRYDFACKVAQHIPVTAEDMFEYLGHWIDYRIAVRRERNLPNKYFDNLKRDCEKQKITDRVKDVLNERIQATREAIRVAEKDGSILAQQAFFGVDLSDSPVNRAIQSVRQDSANETLWLPFELKGLEECADLVK